MPTLQNTLWCHKFPPPLGTSRGLSSRKLLCYSIILDYGNIVGDRSWALPIRCITATAAAAAELQRARRHGLWLPQSSLSAPDVMVPRTVLHLRPALIINSPLWFGAAMQNIPLPPPACRALNRDNLYRLHATVLRWACVVSKSKCSVSLSEWKSAILYLSKVTAGDELPLSEPLAPSECRDDSGLPPGVSSLSGGTLSCRSSSSSDCVRDMDRSLAVLSESWTSELGVPTLSDLPECEHSRSNPF